MWNSFFLRQSSSFRGRAMNAADILINACLADLSLDTGSSYYLAGQWRNLLITNKSHLISSLLMLSE